MRRRTARAHNRGKILRRYIGGSSYEHPHELKLARYQTLFAFTLTMALSLASMLYGKMNTPNHDMTAPILAYEDSQPSEQWEDPALIIPEASQPESPDEPEEKSEKQQIIDYIVEVFGEHAPDAFNVLHCENRSLNPRAINHNRNGTVDRGIFQLNSAYWGGEENFDWKVNIDKAYTIFERAGKKWTPWTCSHKVGQKNYLGN